jgi:signal transduction histidine kinase
VLPAAEAAALFLYEPDTQRLVVRSSSGLVRMYAERLRFRVGEGGAGRTFEDQGPLLLPDSEVVRSYQANLSVESRLNLLHAAGERSVQSALGVPLTAKGVQLGALMLYSLSRANAFDETDVPILQALADQATAALENARLFKEAGEAGALRELNALKSEFVVRASHELRTPLTSVKSLAETLLRPELHLDEATQQELLRGIDSAADRLSGIVNDLLMLARIESGQLEMQKEPIDIAELLDMVVARFATQFPAYRFVVETDAALPLTLGDPERLEDILYNLLSNAVKYSSLGSRVIIAARSGEAGMIAVAVADEGIGIPREQWPHLFERFYRVDNAVTRRVAGAGLGLFICKTYVEAMGGHIGVEDNNGRGAKFWFTLPPAPDIL